MVKLVWLVLVTTAQGPQVGQIPETNKFDSMAICQEFGTAYTPRMQDYMRGMMQAEWSDDILVRFHCDAGKPA